MKRPMQGGDRTGRRRPDDVDDLESDGLAGSDDLRYEGPISLDDDAALEDYEDAGGGKVFLTAALIGAAVILVLGVALFLRRDDAPDAAALAAARQTPRAGSGLSGPTPAGTMPAAERPAAPAGLPVAAPAAGEALEVPAKIAAAPLRDPLPSRAAEADDAAELESSAPPSSEDEFDPPPAAASARAAGTRPAAPERPVPAPASTTADRPRPVPSPLTARTGLPPFNVHELVASGDVAAAASKGAALARQGGWSLQLMLACKPESVKRAFAAVPSNDLFVVPAAKGCYRLLWGRFDDADAARSATGTVPDHFRDAGKARPVALDEIAGS